MSTSAGSGYQGFQSWEYYIKTCKAFRSCFKQKYAEMPQHIHVFHTACGKSLRSGATFYQKSFFLASSPGFDKNSCRIRRTWIPDSLKGRPYIHTGQEAQGQHSETLVRIEKQCGRWRGLMIHSSGFLRCTPKKLYA